MRTNPIPSSQPTWAAPRDANTGIVRMTVDEKKTMKATVPKVSALSKNGRVATSIEYPSLACSADDPAGLAHHRKDLG